MVIKDVNKLIDKINEQGELINKLVAYADYTSIQITHCGGMIKENLYFDRNEE